MNKLETGQVSNKILKKILVDFCHYNHIQNFDIEEVNLSSKWQNKLSDITIFFAPMEFENENNVITGYSNPDNMKLFLNKDDALLFLKKDEDALEYVYRELLLLIEHELTHILHLRTYPKSYNGIEETYNQDLNDYREIEAVSNEAVKLMKEYDLDFKFVVDRFLKSRNIDKKSFIKKFYKKIYL